jgi:hypothetical protein
MRDIYDRDFVEMVRLHCVAQNHVRTQTTYSDGVTIPHCLDCGFGLAESGQPSAPPVEPRE